MNKWQIVEHQRNVHTIQINLPRVQDEQWILLASDVHWDNPKCDRELFTEHLELAKKRNAAVLFGGDLFCAMQGKFDPRSTKYEIRPEHVVGDYLDAIVRDCAKALEPYKNQIALVNPGNHETAILKRHETNLVQALVERLRDKKGVAKMGGYSGYVRLQILDGGGKRRNSILLHYHHGFGGGGPVTRGVIQTNRMAVYLADADIVWTGHTHDHWMVPIQRVRLNQNFGVEQCRQIHVRSAGYKDDYVDGIGGWHIERGGPPKPRGGLWIRLSLDKKKAQYELTEAHE